MITRRSFLQLLAAIPTAIGLPAALRPEAIAKTLPLVDPPPRVGVIPYLLRIGDVSVTFDELSMEGIIPPWGGNLDSKLTLDAPVTFRQHLTVVSSDPECEKLYLLFFEVQQQQVKVEFIVSDVPQRFSADGVMTKISLDDRPTMLLRYHLEMELFNLVTTVEA